jgi:hypothetical protein
MLHAYFTCKLAQALGKACVRARSCIHEQSICPERSQYTSMIACVYLSKQSSITLVPQPQDFRIMIEYLDPESWRIVVPIQMVYVLYQLTVLQEVCVQFLKGGLATFIL